MSKEKEDDYIHQENQYVTLAAKGFDSYYPEYEEYLCEVELHDFSEQITLLIMIMLSRYPAKVTLYNFNYSAWRNEVVREFNDDLEAIKTAIETALVWHKNKTYELKFKFADEDDNEFYITIEEGLAVTYSDLPPTVRPYLLGLTEKVGLSSFLEWR